MDFNSFPAQWEWVALIIGGVAFIMAIPSLLQMKFGAPKIIINFSEDEFDYGYYLSCLVYNMPIIKRMLRALGVRREMVQDIIAHFEIREQGTGRVICPLTAAKIKTQRGIMLERTSLPASLIPARFGIVNFVKDKTEVCVFKEKPQTLLVGAYTVKVELLTSDKLYKAEHNFVVRDTYPFAEWVSS